jgi:L-alanine-DL-glutamate epimerase-like enolase superfamily enzyme
MSRVVEVELFEFDHTVIRRYSAAGTLLKDASPPQRTIRRFGVRVRTDDGLEGGYVPVWSAPPYAVSQVRDMGRLLLGRSIFEREQVWDLWNNAFAKVDRIGAGALDIALWDLAGKHAGLSVSDLLGRYRDRLPVYVSTISGGGGLGSLAGPDSYRDYAAWCANVNIPAFKIHGPSGGKLREEVVTLRAAADGASGRSGVLTDPGIRLHTLADALALGRDDGDYYRTLGLPLDADVFIGQLKRELSDELAALDG